jgi:hypothetical protein
MEHCLRSGGIGEPEIVWMRLYPNQWGLVNNYRDSETGDILKIIKPENL